MEVRVSVMGLGKLGACMAAACAHRGFHTVGVDIDPRAVEAVNAGRAPVLEPGLQAMIEQSKARLTATLDYRFAVANSDVSFVVVPTTRNARGAFSIEYARAAFGAIGRALRDKSAYHLVVLTSTVLPGSTEYGLKPVLEETSGKWCGEDFGLCYSPEFIALGSVIHDFLNPDFALVGEWDRRSGDTLEAVYRSLFENNPPIARMNPVSAELTKIALNTYITTKITYANMLAEICEHLPGADVDAVTNALGYDTRIGRKYLKGAVGYGGPCFPRDNVALSYLLDNLGIVADIPQTVNRLNRRLARRIADIAAAQLREGETAVGVLGLSYKPDTNVVEASHGVEVARLLAKRGLQVTVYDPIAMDNARAVLGDAVHYAASAQACLEASRVVVVMTPWPEFARLSPNGLAHPPAVVDAWRMWRTQAQHEGWPAYIGVGLGNPDEAQARRLQALIREIIETAERPQPPYFED